MSYSANHINRRNYLKDPEKGYLDKDFRKSINYKRESSKKDISRLIFLCIIRYDTHLFHFLLIRKAVAI